MLTHTDVRNNSVTPTPLAPLLKEKYPEIADVTRYHWLWGETILQYDQDVFYEHGIRLVDPTFFNIFKFQFIKGNPETALTDPNSIVMTQEVAEKYFGNENPLAFPASIFSNHNGRGY